MQQELIYVICMFNHNLLLLYIMILQYLLMISVYYTAICKYAPNPGLIQF